MKSAPHQYPLLDLGHGPADLLSRLIEEDGVMAARDGSYYAVVVARRHR